MALSDELSQIENRIRQSDNLDELAQLAARAQTLLANVTQGLAAEKDAALKEHLEGIRQQAEGASERAKKRLAEVKIARMDPSYDQRKADDAAARERKKLEELEKAKQFLAGGGLGNLLGGLLGAAGAGAGAVAPTGAPQTGSRCPKCSAEAGASKFCPQCGTPISRERRCSQCQAKLDAAVKFCGECGSKQS